ncbi:MAG: hypothetical protein H7X94_10495 [Vallitaleaceae bacterium]|nr:hypothetical protein [Vallitaleaceae bacterium]
MGSTKIFVFKLKEIIYTALFIALGILLIFLLIFMFTNKKEKDKAIPTFEYVPGVYTSSVMLDQKPINVEVIVDSNHINSVKIIDLSSDAETLYPLLVPAMNSIESQLINQTSAAVEPLEIKTEYQYTSALLLTAVEDALSKARVESVHK